MYEGIFGEQGALASELERFEPREVQCRVAQAVSQACQNGETLLLEAGTGVGKSLAYLVPVLEWVAASGRRAVVSTCTKTLQNQLLTQDIPLAQTVTQLNVPYALGLGGENYLCQGRLVQAQRSGGSDLRLSDRFLDWTQDTMTGIRGECPAAIADASWRRICRSREHCPPSVCRPGKSCFFQQAREALRKAQLLVVNHYLLFSDLATEGSVLPEYDLLVLDEAHEIEDIATNYLAHNLTRRGLSDLVEAVGRNGGPPGVIDACHALDDSLRHDLRQLADRCHAAVEMFSHELALLITGDARRQRIRCDLSGMDSISTIFDSLRELLRKGAQSLKGGSDEGMLDGVLESVGRTAETSRAVLGPDDPGVVRWLERDERDNLRLGAAPLEIGPLLKERLYDKLHATILVSATLRVGDSFDFMRQRLGATQAVTQAFDSPFDFENNMTLYVPKRGPDPKSGEVYLEYLTQEITALEQRVRGGCFALFTNRRDMLAVHRTLGDSGRYRLREDAQGLVDTRLLLVQGELERDQLMALFREDGNALLLGTNTFWQGVDVPGDALRCVILCRLPFRTPDDPVLEARMERLREQGRNPFMDYQLPQAVMMLRQGAGRLIRHRNDTGVVAILDQRMRTMRYGMLFYKSLPPCHGTASLDEVAERLR